VNKLSYKDWYDLLEQNLDNLVASMDNEEAFYIQEDRKLLMNSFQDFGLVKDSLIEEVSLVNDMKKLNDEIIFYLNLASEDLQNSLQIVK
jgi:hypothetical protein